MGEDEAQEARSIILPAVFRALMLVYERGLQGKVRMGGDSDLTLDQVVKMHNESLSDLVKVRIHKWQQAYLAGVAPLSPLGQWLGSLPLVARVGDALLVHGGIPPKLLQGISSLESLATLARRLEYGDAMLPTLRKYQLLSLAEHRNHHRDCSEVEEALRVLNMGLEQPLVWQGHRVA